MPDTVAPYRETRRLAIKLRARLLRSLLLPFTAVAAVAALAFPGARPLLVWNVSPSSPEGIYAVTPPDGLNLSDTVIAQLPVDVAPLAEHRGYLPAGIPLVKTIVAVEGDRVCGIGSRVSVNGQFVVGRRPLDPSGRRLPWWQGCRVLRKGEMLLLGLRHPASFDGRYFGPSHREEILGRATLLWHA